MGLGLGDGDLGREERGDSSSCLALLVEELPGHFPRNRYSGDPGFGARTPAALSFFKSRVGGWVVYLMRQRRAPSLLLCPWPGHCPFLLGFPVSPLMG